MLFLGMHRIAPQLMIVAGFERIFAMSYHIAWSVLVMQTLREKRMWGLGVAFITHALVDTMIGALAVAGLSVFEIESVLALGAVGAWWYIIRAYKKGMKSNETNIEMY